MTTFTRERLPFKVQSSVGAGTPDFEVSTNGAVKAANSAVTGTLTLSGALVLTSAIVSAAASAGVGVTASHYVKFTVGAQTFYLHANISAF